MAYACGECEPQYKIKQVLQAGKLRESELLDQDIRVDFKSSILEKQIDRATQECAICYDYYLEGELSYLPVKKYYELEADTCIVKLRDQNEAVDSSAEAKVIDIIFKLPKVHQLQHYYDSLKTSEGKLSVMIRKRPASDSDFYIVQVGRDTKDRFIGAFNFKVYKNGGRVYFIDPESGNEIPIEEWNKTK